MGTGKVAATWASLVLSSPCPPSTGCRAAWVGKAQRDAPHPPAPHLLPSWLMQKLCQQGAPPPSGTWDPSIPLHLGPPDVERVSCVQLLLAQVLWVSLGQMVSRQACWSPPSPGLLNCYAEPCKQAAATWSGAGVWEGGLCPLPRS